MTASFHSKVGIFTPLRLKNSSDLDVGRRPELKSDETCDANVIVIEITSQLCLKPLKQVVQSPHIGQPDSNYHRLDYH